MLGEVGATLIESAILESRHGARQGDPWCRIGDQGVGGARQGGRQRKAVPGRGQAVIGRGRQRQASVCHGARQGADMEPGKGKLCCQGAGSSGTRQRAAMVPGKGQLCC